MRLLMLPHAGGSARGYLTFKKFLNPEIKIIALEPSGRGKRINSPCFSDINCCVKDLLQLNQECFKDNDYALFGHSMGSVLALETVHQLREQNMPEPIHIFFSGKTSPDNSIKADLSENSTDDEILDFFADENLTDAKNSDLLKLIAPILISDVRMVQKYKITPDDLMLNCDISILYGTEDKFLNRPELEEWALFTDKSCELYPFSGGHFYFQNQKENVCKIINNVLERYIIKK